MTQNTISEPLSATDLEAMDAAVTALEMQFVELIKWFNEERQQHKSSANADSDPLPMSVPTATLDAMNTAIGALKAQFDKTVRLSDAGRRRLPTLDEKTEAFCRETLTLLEHNRDQLPPDFDLDSALSRLRAYDAVHLIKARLRRLSGVLDT